MSPDFDHDAEVFQPFLAYNHQKREWAGPSSCYISLARGLGLRGVKRTIFGLPVELNVLHLLFNCGWHIADGMGARIAYYYKRGGRA